MKRCRLCAVTSSRAEYDLIRNILLMLENEENIDLYVIATGTHLKSEFGYTVERIREDNFINLHEIDILENGDDRKSMGISIGKGVVLFTEFFSENDIDTLFVLGDRFEIFSAAITARVLDIPIIHLSGGDTTEGAIDNDFRHSISLMSKHHFVKLESHRKLLEALGIPSKDIEVIGALALENCVNYQQMSLSDINQKYNINITTPFALVTFHPVTLPSNTYDNDFNIFLEGLSVVEDLYFLFTAANGDFGGRSFNQAIKKWVEKNHSRSTYIESLGRDSYFSLLSMANLMIGNSSSGLLESGSFHLPVVNVTPRQNGRARNENVLDVENTPNNMVKAIAVARSKIFRDKCSDINNIFEVMNPASISHHVVESIKKRTGND